ncbi:MAG: AhpC/TSA family protein, partial [Acidobacteria bacterium]|nr:AhpC/TSA family protein [Acidobacteriota bacterium]
MSGELGAALKAQNEAGRARIPEDQLVVMDGATDALRVSGLAEGSLAVGAHAPDFKLPDSAGEHVSLSSLLSRGPVVLAFYRGGWCPYCSTELRAYQSRLADISSLGATLVAVSPQTPDNSLSTQEKLELAFP